MALENKKGSINISKIDGDSSNLPSADTFDGKIFTQVETVAKSATSSADGSTYIVARVPSDAIVVDIKYGNTAITGASDADIGIYKHADKDNNIGTVVDKDLFLDGVTMANARTGLSGDGILALTADKIGKKLYELEPTPLTTKPGYDYDIVITLNTAGSGTGTMSAKVSYLKA